MEHLIDEAVEVMKRAEEEDAGMLWTGGKDSMIMLYLWREHIGGQPPLLIVDTDNQFEEVYEFRERIAEDWGLEYEVKKNEEFLNEVIYNPDDERGFAWDGFKTTECCGHLKIDVIGMFIEDGYDNLIVGRRSADVDKELPLEKDERDPQFHHRFHPLANWPDELIESFINREGIPLPEVYVKGYNHTDCVDCTFKGEEGDDWSGVSAEKKQQLAQLRDMGYM